MSSRFASPTALHHHQHDLVLYVLARQGWAEREVPGDAYLEARSGSSTVVRHWSGPELGKVMMPNAQDCGRRRCCRGMSLPASQISRGGFGRMAIYVRIMMSVRWLRKPLMHVALTRSTRRHVGTPVRAPEQAAPENKAPHLDHRKRALNEQHTNKPWTSLPWTPSPWLQAREQQTPQAHAL